MSVMDVYSKGKFDVWLAELYYIVASHTGVKPREVRIDKVEAAAWFMDGFSPYQCFRENWGMENDSE